MARMSKVLVVAPHPDDEAIGVGGTIALHVDAGDEVFVLYLTRGELGCPGQDTDETALLRIHEGFQASEVLGSKVFAYWEEADGNLQANTETIQKMAVVLVTIKPDAVYVTHSIDGHADHRAANAIVKGAIQQGFIRPVVWQYEVWTPMASYDLVNDITNEIGTKLRAIRMHESQVSRIRFDEAALCLARFRGELHNRPHGMYAEVFSRMEI
jgi:LmbE family N-acetylglucosaminyl deacetylase